MACSHSKSNVEGGGVPYMKVACFHSCLVVLSDDSPTATGASPAHHHRGHKRHKGDHKHKYKKKKTKRSKHKHSSNEVDVESVDV